MIKLRLGAPIGSQPDSPASWIAELKRNGYRAAYAPVGDDAPDGLIAEYRAAAEENDIVIAEVGGWSNLLAPDKDVAEANVAMNIRRLRLADKLGAKCCVNISGNPSDTKAWDAYFEGYDSEQSYRRIAETVKRIIDEAQPEHAYYALECMQWMLPDSIESYERLINIVDRPQFGVHFDPVNLINCPSRYDHNGEFIREFVHRLGRHICSVHAKDVILQPQMLVHLSEIRAGLGKLDYEALLTSIADLNTNIPIMLEHLKSLDEYALAAQYVREVGERVGLKL